ncbi:MAG: hypothetical protein V3T23_04045, partial [Nitrososphaerales archaeon]
MTTRSPSVQLLLSLDVEYRQKAEAGELKKIAPKTHNQDGEAWLSILSTDRVLFRFTFLFSYTAWAHEL